MRELTHGVKLSLCDGHHSVEFMRSNAGRDFAVTLMRTWRAQGCFTRARSRALAAHLTAVRALGSVVPRSRPGSYAWPRLRREAEDCFARGDGTLTTIDRLREQHARGSRQGSQHPHDAALVRAMPLVAGPGSG